ncbi:protein EARLY FLOWERING 4-like [Salvia hispanica]|uniref:protein EARLY FLOWERING 4-like n=1 Tax=Salvia hispanica TaxID=49212 RepID=UPI002009AC9F|nr:protein EARLY FLOWERING 4-like [Salvia hispanica]XP_047954247.1 protein EARLY FLOWERING 4-like [Salvia hispanica]
MNDASNFLISAASHRFSDDEEDEDDLCDVETWEALSKSFGEVQSVLDRNRRLIQQVNDNHRSKLPDNLAKNVALICEINDNMSRVVGLYSGLSATLSAAVRRRREGNGILK